MRYLQFMMFAYIKLRKKCIRLGCIASWFSAKTVQYVLFDTGVFVEVISME